MTNKTLKISTLTFVLLLSLTLTAITVQADPVGVGKYLTINIDGQGFVTATKVNSGEVFLFNTTNPEHKVGAGTVLLQANASEGWQFVEWTGDYLSSSINPVNFKTEKYANITAVFREKTYFIEASSNVPTEIGSINPDGTTLVKHGEDQTFTFTENDDAYHISSIIVDGSFLTSVVSSYTFEKVSANHTISVIFSKNGEAFVPQGTSVSVFIGEGAGITFANTEGGIATGEPEDFPENTSVIVWELNYTAAFSGGAQIALSYDDTGLTYEQEFNLTLISGESLEALYSDVNGDLIVDGQDVSIIANAVNTNTQPDWYDPFLDINNDGEVDKEDIFVVNSYKGTILENIKDYVDTVNNIIYGTTSHFSVFRCR